MRLLLHHPKKLWVCQNIAGAANVCFIPLDVNGKLNQEFFDSDTGLGKSLSMQVYVILQGELEYDKNGDGALQGMPTKSSWMNS